MQLQPIKAIYRDMNRRQLRQAISTISNFILNHPENPRLKQAWYTTSMLWELRESMRKKDELRTNILKHLFFE